MASLFLYGDSISATWTSAMEYKSITKDQGHYAREFKKNNNRVPLHFSKLLETKFNIEKTYNFSVAGCCNYTILESISETFHLIKPDDYVFFQWSDISRYRSVQGDLWFNHHIKDKDNSQSIQRVSKVSIKEIENWTNMLKQILPVNTFFWTIFPNLPVFTLSFDKLSKYLGQGGKITDDTDYNILDNHWSDLGHKGAGEILYKAFMDKDKFI